MKYFGATNIGNSRKKNEDYFYISDNLFIVADGMGGHLAGEIASELAVNSFLNTFKSIINKNPGLHDRTIKKNMLKAVGLANNEVFKKSMADPACSGMGTTLTACFLNKENIHISHIGDSRAYLCRNKNIELLSSDHTFVAELYRRGEISYEETFSHPQRNFLTKVLGVADNVDSDYLKVKALPGDHIILCSDGLNSMLKDENILKITQKYKDPENIVNRLIDSALKKGGNDNITVIAIRF